jgi:hypothetical protein
MGKACPKSLDGIACCWHLVQCMPNRLPMHNRGPLQSTRRIASTAPQRVRQFVWRGTAASNSLVCSTEDGFCVNCVHWGIQ